MGASASNPFAQNTDMVNTVNTVEVYFIDNKLPSARSKHDLGIILYGRHEPCPNEHITVLLTSLLLCFLLNLFSIKAQMNVRKCSNYSETIRFLCSYNGVK